MSLAGDENDAGVGSGRLRRFTDLYGFSFTIPFWSEYGIPLRDSGDFSLVNTFQISIYTARTALRIPILRHYKKRPRRLRHSYRVLKELGEFRFREVMLR